MYKSGIITVMMLCFAISCGSAFGKPLIQFPKLEHDFGSIKQETVVKEIIKFKNAGNSDLVILDVQTSCGCTGTKIDKTTIAPGEEGSLEISFNSGHYEGPVTRSVIITTNDPKNARIIFKIKANVKK
jgi:hypothetical protein